MADLSDQELTMAAMSAGFMLSTMHGQSTHKQMPVSDSATIIKLCRAAIAADRALNAPQAAPVAQAERAGWVLVPVEPTDAMVDATYHGQPVADIWRDMINAAPTPDQTKG